MTGHTVTVSNLDGGCPRYVVPEIPLVLEPGLSGASVKTGGS